LITDIAHIRAPAAYNIEFLTIYSS